MLCVSGRQVRERDGKHVLRDVRGGPAQRQRERLVCVRAVWRGPVPERGGPGAVRRVSYGQVRRRDGKHVVQVVLSRAHHGNDGCDILDIVRVFVWAVRHGRSAYAGEARVGSV